MAKDKQVIAGAAGAQAILMRDYTQDVLNLNDALDRVMEERAAAEEDIAWWEQAVGVVGAIAGAVIGSVGGPVGSVAGAKAGYQLGSSVGGGTADYFIEGDERTLYDEIDKRDFKFGFDEMRQYEADFDRMNAEDTAADWNQFTGSVVDAGTTYLMHGTDWGVENFVDTTGDGIVDSSEIIPGSYYEQFGPNK